MNETHNASDSTEDAYRLFAQWLELDGAARDELLDRVRNDNSSAHARLQQLIFADSEADRLSFMGDGAKRVCIDKLDACFAHFAAGQG